LRDDSLVDRRSDHLAGLIHVGANPLQVRVGGQYDRHDPSRYHYRPYGHSYRPGHYYHGYRSCYYPGYAYSSPFFGYSYSTVYLADPYVVRVYDRTEPTVYYDDSPSAYRISTSETVTQAPPLPASPAGQQMPSEDYQQLPSAPQNTIVVEGNAAFAAGRYEDARRSFIRAVLADERDGYAKVLYAWASFALGDFDVAAAALRRALLTTSDLITYPMDLRTLYSDPAPLSGQIDALFRFNAEHPANRESGLLLGYLFYSIGEADRAASILNGLADSDRTDTMMALIRDSAVRAARGPTPPSRREEPVP